MNLLGFSLSGFVHGVVRQASITKRARRISGHYPLYLGSSLSAFTEGVWSGKHKHAQREIRGTVY